MSESPQITNQNAGLSALKLGGVGASLLASAYAMLVAIQSPDMSWLGWLTLLPLLLAIKVLSPRVATLAGAFWGLSFFALACLEGHAPFAPNLGSALLLAAIPAAYAGVGSLVTRQVGFSPLLLGLGWVGVEIALHPLAMQNGLLARTQGDGLALYIVGNFAGYAVVAFLVAYVSASILSVLHEVYVWVAGQIAIRVARAIQECLEGIECLFAFGRYVGTRQPRGPPMVPVRVSGGFRRP